jgi:thiazole synthase ThiGH ThiG subunit
VRQATEEKDVMSIVEIAVMTEEAEAVEKEEVAEVLVTEEVAVVPEEAAAQEVEEGIKEKPLAISN